MPFLFWAGALMWIVMWKVWDKVAHDKTGGGSSPQPAQVIPAPAAPNVADTARQSAEAQLQYNPQLTAQAVQLQGQYGPQLAQQQYDLQAQFAPLYRALIEQQFPQITTLAQQTQQGLSNPMGLNDQQQAAQDAVRGRALAAQDRLIRESANVGGTLYGGRRQEREDQSRNELLQGFATEDINRQQQQRAQTMQELLSLFQLAGFNVQQPSVPNYNTSAAPSGDNLYNALVQNQGNFGVIQGTPGDAGLGPAAIGAGGGIIAAKVFVMCLPGNMQIDTPNGGVAIESLRAGDDVIGGTVLFKNEYAPQETIFVKLTLEDGREIETCDAHVISGIPAMAYTVGDLLAGSKVANKQISVRTERTYDILTSAPSKGYFINGIHVSSMIPTIHKIGQQLEALL